MLEPTGNAWHDLFRGWIAGAIVAVVAGAAYGAIGIANIGPALNPLLRGVAGFGIAWLALAAAERSGGMRSSLLSWPVCLFSIVAVLLAVMVAVSRHMPPPSQGSGATSKDVLLRLLAVGGPIAVGAVVAKWVFFGDRCSYP